MIKFLKYSSAPRHIKNYIEPIAAKEFSVYPLVAETQWVTPHWIALSYHDDEIVTFCNIVEREIFIDDKMYKAAGLNNLVTPEKFRGNGYGTKLVIEFKNFIFNKINCDLGLLLCSDNLVPFYEKLGWYLVDCPVHYWQPQGIKLWQANTMLLNPDSSIQPGRIHLNGLPW
jgi:GNAT superfamily N-acetyltransferase